MESVIDTNVLIYDMMEDSEFHERAKDALDKIEAQIIPLTVVEEVVHVLQYLKVNKDVISKKIMEILNFDILVSAGRNEIVEAIHILNKEKASYRRFNDKLILGIAKEKGLPLLTFDEDLAKECNMNGIKTL